ncbi:MAG: ATP-binding protein [Bacteroidota bacterium]
MGIYRRLRNRPGIAQVNYHLGALWFERKDYEQALHHFSSALAAYTELSDADGRIQTLSKLGRTYGALRDYKKSLQFGLEALGLAQQLKDDFLQTSINTSLGTAYLNLGELGDALKYYRVALDYAEELENDRLIVQVAGKLGDTYHALCNEPKAAEYYKKAIDLAQDIDNKNVHRDLYQSLYEYHDEYGRTDMAYAYLKKLTQIKEELYSEERTRQFINNQIRYQTATKEEENKRLKANELEHQVIISNQRIQNYVLTFFIILALLATYFLYNAFRQKKAYNQELQNEVKKQTLSLEKSNEELLASNKQLEQSNNELERFAYIASHDLKSPLRNIISFLNLIQRKMRKYDDEDLKEYLRFATDNAKQMNQLIADVLEFSRIQHVESEKQPVDLNESLILVMQNVQELMEEKHAIVESHSLPVVQANSVHVLQLFQNLVGNGIKYNENPNPKVFIRHRSEADHYVFSITDNGIGIEPEFHEKIFQMFKRLHTGKEYSGTGIGLAVCKKIINNWGGKIWLESDPGEGTTFYFTIPTLSTE